MIALTPPAARDPEENRLDLALEDLTNERYRQDQRWGEQNHTPIEWISILLEEVGSQRVPVLRTTRGSAQQANHVHWHKHNDQAVTALLNYREELIQVAAVLPRVRRSLGHPLRTAVQCLDRTHWREDHHGS